MPTKPGGAVSGAFPSLKLGRSVRYASSIERDFLFFVEYDPQVVSYTEQPFAITGTLPDDSSHQYTPDFLVQRHSGPELVECKPAHDLDEPHTRQQCWLGQTWAEAHGYSFRVVTDIELRRGAELANLKLLWRYSRVPVTMAQTNCCLKMLETHGALTVARLAGLVQSGRYQEAVPLIYHLLFHHRLRTDLTQPLTTDSCLSKEA